VRWEQRALNARPFTSVSPKPARNLAFKGQRLLIGPAVLVNPWLLSYVFLTARTPTGPGKTAGPVDALTPWRTGERHLASPGRQQANLGPGPLSSRLSKIGACRAAGQNWEQHALNARPLTSVSPKPARVPAFKGQGLLIGPAVLGNPWLLSYVFLKARTPTGPGKTAGPVDALTPWRNGEHSLAVPGRQQATERSSPGSRPCAGNSAL
jgi:hypothetical protein